MKIPELYNGKLLNMNYMPNKRILGISGTSKKDTVNFGGIPERLAAMVPKKVLMSKFLHKMLKLAENNPVLFEAFVVLGLTATLRPATIIAVPGTPKEDRHYAAAKSIATGIIAILFGLIFYNPIAKAIKTQGLKVAASVVKGAFPEYGSRKYDAFSYIINYGSKFIIAPLEAAALFKIVPFIIKKIFPGKKDAYTYPIPSISLGRDYQALFNFNKTGKAL